VQWIKTTFGEPIVALRLLPSDGSPESWIETAAKGRQVERRKGTYFDEVWCMFDVSDSRSIAGLEALAKRKTVRLALGCPSFESWLRLHFDESTLAQPLADLIPELSVEAFESRLRPGLDAALRKSRSATGGGAIHVLVDALATQD